MSTQNDVLKVKVKLNKARLELQKAQSGLKLTRMALCRTVGLPFETEIVTTDSLSTVIDPVAPGKVQGISFRPEYSLLEKQIELASEKIRLTRADFLPTAGLQVGYNYIGGIKYADQNYEDGNASIIASLKIPLFHWGEGAKKIKSAEHQVDIKKAQLEKNSRLLELEITQARLNLNDAVTRINMAKESLAQADENLRVTTDNYELGMKILPELLEAQAQWQQAYSELIDARADCKIKESAYLKATGKLAIPNESEQ